MTAVETNASMTAADAAALSPTERVERLIDLTERLGGVIGKENELITTRRAREIAPYQAEKTRLAAAYAEEIRAIAADRNRYRGASERLIAKLKQLTREFEDKAAHQRALIDGVKRVSEGLIKAVAEEVQKSAPSGAAYGASAQASHNPAVTSLTRSRSA